MNQKNIDIINICLDMVTIGNRNIKSGYQGKRRLRSTIWQKSRYRSKRKLSITTIPICPLLAARYVKAGK